MNDEQLFRHDLWQASFHESAHVTVATALGHIAYMKLRRVDSPGRYDKLVVGRTFLHSKTAPEDERLIGLAGTVAEHLLEDFETGGCELMDYIDSGAIELSATDADMAGDFEEDDLDKCIALVRQHWGDINEMAGLHFELGVG